MSVSPSDSSRGRTETGGSDMFECATRNDAIDDPADATLAADHLRILRLMQQANACVLCYAFFDSHIHTRSSVLTSTRTWNFQVFFCSEWFIVI